MIWSSRQISDIQTPCGPGVSRKLVIGTTPSVQYLPLLGLKPTMPHKAYGIRVLPAVSDPIPQLAMPAAIADALPLLLPPQLYSKLMGFKHRPWIGELPVIPTAISNSWSARTVAPPAFGPHEHEGRLGLAPRGLHDAGSMLHDVGRSLRNFGKMSQDSGLG